MDLEALLRLIEGRPWYRGQIVAVRSIPARDAEHGEPSMPLVEPLQRYLDARGIRLYAHQAEVIERIRAGQNVFITTPTASGKTLAFNLPILEALQRDPRATALYLYPLKALANDQLRTIQELEAATGIELRAAVYDGDTPEHLRPRIRQRSRLVLTNPYALHQYLPWHHRWRRFFRNLRFVVIDEAHRYRGVFGSNVALLIRRLRRVLQRYGADPQFVLCSATIANPEEFSRKLTGKPFAIVDRDGSPRGPRHFVFWNPLKHPGRSVHRQTSDLLALCVEAGLQTLCFTVSRSLAELVARWARESLPHRRIAAYRAGYLPEERRRIERDLKERRVDAVASTNALELGVDIGGLDAVIISGYPGTAISVWQQAGRAGRGRKPAVVFLVGFENPLDQYFLNHPDELLRRGHEHAIVDPQNAHLLMGHLLCAAAELPLGRSELGFFGAHEEHLRPLEERFLQRTPHGWIYRGTVRPMDLVSLDNLSDRTIEVRCEGELLETLDLPRALEEAHPGAILLHQGETYRVEELDLGRGVAVVRRAEVDHYTEAVKRSEVGVVRPRRGRNLGGLQVWLGELHIEERVIGYRLRRYERTLGFKELDLPPVDFETVGLWLLLPDDLRQRVEGAGLGWAGGLHGAEHALIAMAPLQAMCDRWDLGGVSTPVHPDTGGPTIFVYDGFPQGAGIAEKLWELFPAWVKAAHRLVGDCGCEAGCPSCIYSPKCGNHNEPLDKAATSLILSEVQRLAEGPAGAR